LLIEIDGRLHLHFSFIARITAPCNQNTGTG
jgi:hypothetical protein